MQPYIKSLIATGILFLSLITSVAFSYAITPTSQAVEPAKNIEVKMTIDKKKVQFNINKTLKPLIPRGNG